MHGANAISSAYTYTFITPGGGPEMIESNTLHTLQTIKRLCELATWYPRLTKGRSPTRNRLRP